MSSGSLRGQWDDHSHALSDGVYVTDQVLSALFASISSWLATLWGKLDMSVCVPPVLPLTYARQTGYLLAWPHLLTVAKTAPLTALPASDRQREASRLGADTEWSNEYTLPAAVLTPSACHGVYASVPRPLPRLPFSVGASAVCYRNEEATGVGRLRSFSMVECVVFGVAEDVRDTLHRVSTNACDRLRGLGITVSEVAAADSFFDSRLRSIAQPSKVELVCHLSDGTTLALGSTNLHGERFVRRFNIAEVGAAQSGCVGFGLERIAMALLDAVPDIPHWQNVLAARRG